MKPTFHFTVFTLYVSSVPWGYHEYCGGYLEYRRDIMMQMGGYYEYCVGAFITVGEKIFTIVTPMDPSGTVSSVIHVWDPPLKQLPSQQQIHWYYVRLRMGPI